MMYTYRAYRSDGREESGTIEAIDEAQAVRLLSARRLSAFHLDRANGVSRTWVDVRPKPSKRRRLSESRLFLDLAVLTESGLTLPQAMRALLLGETDPTQRKVIDTIANGMSNGRTAAGAFADAGAFSGEAIALLASGERSTQIPTVLRALASQMAGAERRRAALRNALAYPVFLLAMTGLVLAVILFVLVPALTPIFQNAGRPAPPVLQVLDAIRNGLTEPPLQAAGLVLMLATLALRYSRVRAVVVRHGERAALRVPWLGLAIHKAGAARYLGSLGMLLGGGTPVTEALSLAATCNPLASLRLRLGAVRDRVATGQRLPAAMDATQIFDPRVISLVAVGDEAGRLPAMLGRASTILEEEADAIISRLLATIAPAVTIVLGLLIGGLVVSVMTALLSINDLAVEG